MPDPTHADIYNKYRDHKGPVIVVDWLEYRAMRRQVGLADNGKLMFLGKEVVRKYG